MSSPSPFGPAHRRCRTEQTRCGVCLRHGKGRARQSGETSDKREWRRYGVNVQGKGLCLPVMRRVIGRGRRGNALAAQVDLPSRASGELLEMLDEITAS